MFNVCKSHTIRLVALCMIIAVGCINCTGSSANTADDTDVHASEEMESDINNAEESNNSYNNGGRVSEAEEWQPQTRMVQCSLCYGTGRCGACGGSGTMYSFGDWVNCSCCGGSGACGYCHGSGMMEEYVW